MLKLLAATVVALAGASHALPVLAAEAPVAGASSCVEKNPSGGDIRVITCALPAGHAHRLTARFGGGHDDTSASLTATLDGQPTDCDTGSKMKLFGEDGDVSLHCRVTAAGDASSKHELVVTVLFSHAQYRDFLFAAE